MTKKEQQQLDQDLRCVQCGAEITYGLTCSNECHDARLADLDAQAYQSVVDEEGELVPDYSDDDDECSDNRAEDNRAYNEMRYKEAKYYVGKYN